jgi:WD40 repeat protein
MDHDDGNGKDADSKRGHLYCADRADQPILLVAQNDPSKAELVVQTGHSGEIQAVAFSPDGRLLATGGDDATVKLWDVASGLEIRTLYGLTDKVMDVEFSPDGKNIAGCGDSVIRLWDTATGAAVKRLSGHTWNVNSIEFSPDGKRLASASIDQTVRLWDVAAGAQLSEYKGSERFGAVAFNPDGKTLAAADDGYKISLFDAADLKLIKEIRGVGTRPHGLAFLNDGNTLVSGDADSVKLWDTAAGTLRRTLKRAEGDPEVKGIDSMALSFDRRVIAAVDWSSGRLLLWDAQTGNPLPEPERTTGGSMRSIAIARSGEIIATGGNSRVGSCEVRLWSVAEGRQTRIIGESFVNDVYSMHFSPTGRALATTSSGQFGNGIRIWSFDGTEPLISMRNGTNSMPIAAVFTPSGSFARNIFDGIEILNAETGKRERVLPNLELSPASVFTPDGKRVITPRYKDVVISDFATGKQVGKIEDFDVSYWLSVPHLLAVHPNGDLLAGLDKWGKVRFWEIPSGRSSPNICSRPDFVGSFGFSPNGRMFATSGEKGVIVCGIGDARQLSMQAELPDVRMDSLVFSPDSRTLVGINQQFTYVWDVATGRLRFQLPGQPHSSIFKNAAAFGSGGKVLFTTFGRSRVKVWNAATGRELASLLTFGEDEWVVVAPDGRFDTNKDLINIEGLHWVMSDDPLRPVPLEVFMRQYYEPGPVAACPKM